MRNLSVKTLIAGAAGALAFSFGLATPAFAQERVASLGGDLTEIIYALGEGDRIVATDTTSVYPLSALATPKVGYVRQLSAEGVLSVEPDLILISGAAGPDTALDQIRATGVSIVEMETEYTVDAILNKTRRVAEALGVEEKGEALAAEIEADWAAAQVDIGALPDNPSVLFFSTVSDGSPTAAGKETAAQGVIDMLGGENVFGDRLGYKPISLEAAVAADPDIILVMNFVAARMGGLEAVADHPAISLTTAAQTGRIFMIDAVQVMQFSPRTPKATGALAAEIKAALEEVDGT
ncbi:MAG: ABC transporter substrate-binding protein [Pseudomonadota bacterium]